MAENENTTLEELTPTPEEILEDLKRNTVPKEDYEKLVGKYNKLFYDVANGRQIEGEQKDLHTSALEAIKRIQNKELHTPREHIDALLTIDADMRGRGQRSIFLPSEGEPNEATVDSTDRVRALLQKALDQSDGSDEIAAAIIGNSLRDVK